jgi:hypothetical protein
MIKWILSLFRRNRKPKHTPTIVRKPFPRLKTLDSRIAAARGVEFDKDVM